MRCEREILNFAPQFPFGAALPQVVFDTHGGLVAVLGILCQELHDDGR